MPGCLCFYPTWLPQLPSWQHLLMTEDSDLQRQTGEQLRMSMRQDLGCDVKYVSTGVFTDEQRYMLESPVIKRPSTMEKSFQSPFFSYLPPRAFMRSSSRKGTSFVLPTASSSVLQNPVTRLPLKSDLPSGPVASTRPQGPWHTDAITFPAAWTMHKVNRQLAVLLYNRQTRPGIRLF